MNPKPETVRLVAAGCAIESLCVGILSIGDINKNIPLFAIFYFASFLVYIVTAFSVCKSNPAQKAGEAERCPAKTLWIIVAFAIIFRLTLLPVTPSNDLFRYLWEGSLQLNGFNPYSFPPESAKLIHLRDSFFHGINHKDLTTIYSPLTLIGFAVTDLICHSLMAMKLFFTLFDTLLIFLLIRFLRRSGRSPINVVIYAWSPLVLVSFAGHGHSDSLQIFFVILALYSLSTGKNITSVTVAGLAAVSKFTSIIVIPFFILNGRLRYLPFLFIPVIVLYTPYIDAGSNLFATIYHFGAHYHFNDSLNFVISQLTSDYPAISGYITPLLLSAVLLTLYIKYSGRYLMVAWKIRGNSSNNPNGNDPVRFAFLAIGAFLMLAPTVHPWYLTWIAPFLCFYPSRGWMVLTGSVVFYYFMNHALFSTLINFENEWVWREVNWLKLPEYLPFYSLLIYDFLKKRTE